MADATVTWRGRRFSGPFRDSQVEADRLCPGFVLTQGGFNGNRVSASAGTHAGDAADYSVRWKTKAQVAAFITAQRKVGNAAWFRTTWLAKWGVRAHGFGSYHIHVVPNGWGLPSASARRQALGAPGGRREGYRNGRDGLKGNGQDAGGPGHTSAFYGRSWYDYKALTAKPVPPTVPSRPGVNPSTGMTTSTIASGAGNRDEYGVHREWHKRPYNWIHDDGKMGAESWGRLQEQLSVAKTGKLDHFTIRALRVWLGRTPLLNGLAVLDPSTISALQGRVGSRKDGIWNPGMRVVSPTTQQLQRYLNRNRL